MKKKVKKRRQDHTPTSLYLYKFTSIEDGMTVHMSIIKNFWLSHEELMATTNVRKLTNCASYFIELNECNYDCIDASFFIKLAKKINSHYPNHQINWINTFQALEEYEYVKQILNRHDDRELDEDDVSVHITAPKKDGKRFPRKKESNLIREQVILKLNYNDLIK